jgi:hypothetical protein
MPATGAAATYKRMKTGTEGQAGLVLGPDAATMTAVLGSAPGPLQLLPSREYGMGWLKIKDREQFDALPKSDPYSEIYTERRAWWGLCDDKLLNPLDPQKKTIERDWANFEMLIKYSVRMFHTQISGKYHDNTYVFYGDDKEHKAFGNVHWQRQARPLPGYLDIVTPLTEFVGGQVSHFAGPGGKIVATDGSGEAFGARLQLHGADENGDGTVPIRSGKAPHGRVRVCVAYPGVDHEGAYKLESTQRFTLWAITKIAQSVKGTVMEYKE